MSEVCEAFGCLPDEAERQDWPLVRAILDYRAAKAGERAWRDVKHGPKILRENPGLADALLRMTRAQQGEGATMDHLYALMANRPREEDDDVR